MIRMYRDGQMVAEATSLEQAQFLIGAQLADAMHADDLRLARMPEIVAERSRRLALGFDFDFGGVRGVHHIATSESDMAGWNEVTMAAQALLAQGDGETAIQIVTDTGPCEVTAAEWMDVLVAAAAHRQPIWGASFALQAMEPLPADVTADIYWP